MAIEITKRPFYYCFSKNPVAYQLYSAAAAASPDAGFVFEIKVIFISIAGVTTETEAFRYTPVGGYADADIQDIVESFLEYELPFFDPDETKVWPSAGQTGFFYIRFREISSSNLAPSWDDSEKDFQSLGVKGGISRFKYQGNNFFTNYFNGDVPRAARPFLTWQQSGRLAAVEERMYLAFLLIDYVAPLELKVIATAWYVGGGNQVIDRDVPTDLNTVYYLPAGATQWGFDLSRQIWYWEIKVLDASDGTALSQTFRYEADNRADYNNIFLHYRTSLGGIDSVQLRGVINYDLDYDYTEVQKIQPSNYFDGHYFDRQKLLTNNKELQTLRGDIGHLDKEEQDRLRDAFLERETWWAISKKWWPVNIVTKSIKQKSSESNRWNLPLDFTLAHEGDSSYTPDNVDLGVGTFTSNVCRAHIGDITLKIEDGPTGFKTITVAFVEVDPENASSQIKYRVKKQNDATEVITWTTINFTSPLVFNLPVSDYYVFEVRCICANAVVGKLSSVYINTNNNVAPTGNSVIKNTSNSAASFSLSTNGSVQLNGYLGTNSQFFFTMAAGAGVVVGITMLDTFSPSTATISNGAVTVNGTIVNGNGFVYITFPAIDITAGVTITLS